MLAGGLVSARMFAAASPPGWAVYYDSVSREALQHLAPGQGRRGFPMREMLLHPFKVLATVLPWSLVGLLTLRRSFWQSLEERSRFLLIALHCWLWPNLLFWSLAS